MQKALEGEFGFECTTFVRTAKQLRSVLDARPFTLAAGDTHFVTFLKKAPSTSDAKRLEGLSNDFDTLVVHGAEVHWRMRGRLHRLPPQQARLGEGPWPREQHQSQRHDADETRGEL